jgi:hypothetical protein
VDVHLARLDLGEVEDVVDERQQVRAGAWIVSANSTLLSVRLPSGFSERSLARMSSELSGVRSSWLMLARNSDLYLEDSASWEAFSSSPIRARRSPCS